MTTIYMKRIGNALVPDCDEEVEKIKRFKVGKVIKCEVAEMRNGAFFRKWWSLMSTAFDMMSANVTPMMHNGVPVRMCKEHFRKSLIITAGYFDAVYGIDGSVQLTAHSLKWSQMTEETFEELYSATIDAILQHVLPGLDEEDLNEAMERTLAYA